MSGYIRLNLEWMVKQSWTIKNIQSDPVNCESAHGVLPMENNEKTPQVVHSSLDRSVVLNCIKSRYW